MILTIGVTQPPAWWGVVSIVLFIIALVAIVLTLYYLRDDEPEWRDLPGPPEIGSASLRSPDGPTSHRFHPLGIATTFRAPGTNSSPW